MQHDYFRNISRRACSVFALAACASTAWATPEVQDGSAAVAASTPAPVAQPDRGAVAATEAPERAAAAPLVAMREAKPVVETAGFGQPADLGKLEASRGGTDLHSDMKLDGIVTGNSAVNVVTGSNTIDAGAFANMSGIPVVIQNSGANVLIQNATIVNLQFK